MSSLIKRDEQKLENTWLLEDIFSSNEEWENAFAKSNELAAELAGLKGTLSDSPESMAHALQLGDQLEELIEKVYVFANMRSHEDMGNSFYQGLADRATSLTIQIGSQVSFIEPEILSMPVEKLEKFMATEELAFYKKSLEKLLRQKNHILPEKEEELLTQARELAVGPQNIFTMLNNADFKFPAAKDSAGKEHNVTHGTFVTLLTNKDRTLRENAYKSLYSTFINHKNSLGATYSASVKGDVFFAKARHYDSSLAKALSPNNIDKAVYSNLISAVHDQANLMHRYIDLRKKVLGVDQLMPYDLYVPIVEEKKTHISYEEAKETIIKALAPLGEDYIKVLKEGFEKRWVDIYENEGKRSGAYSWGPYGTHPYVLLNYTSDMKDMFTVAHEMGHALHSYYSDHALEYRYAQYPIFLAEVASTVNEALLMHYLLENTTDEDERMSLLNYYMEQFRGTLYRQTLFAEFENLAHEKVEKGESLNADVLSELYAGLNKIYYGDELTIDKQISMEWSRIPHFYNAYYVYQYATGYSAAIAISKRIIEEGAPAVEDYFKFLSGGGCDDPLTILSWAGVDMTSPEPVKDALAVFDGIITEMETLLLGNK